MSEDQTPDKGTEQDKSEIESQNESLGEGGDPKDKSQELSKPEEDVYKKKFTESSRENQILLDKLKITEEKLGKVEKNEIPAEEELKKIYSNWEDMTEQEQGSATNNLLLKRRVDRIDQEVGGLREENSWEAKLNNFLERAKLLDEYPELEKKKTEFRKFAKMPSHKGASIEVLARAFLFKGAKEVPSPTHKGSVLERGSGGEKINPAPKKKLTPEELSNIRLNDPKEYKKIIMEHPDWLPTEID